MLNRGIEVALIERSHSLFEAVEPGSEASERRRGTQQRHCHREDQWRERFNHFSHAG